MLMFLSLLLLSVIDGVPLIKMHGSELLNVSIKDSGLMKDLMSSKNDHKALLSIISEADPAKLNAVVALVRELLETSKSELEELTTNSDNADVAYSNAVIAHETAIGAYDQGVIELKTAYDQGVSALQAGVDVAKGVKDTSSATKNTANGVLAAEKSRLESEISALTDIIALIEGLNPVGAFVLKGCNNVKTRENRGRTEGDFYNYCHESQMTVDDCFTACNGDVVVPQSKEESMAISELLPDGKNKVWLGLKKEMVHGGKNKVWTRNGSPYISSAPEGEVWEEIWRPTNIWTNWVGDGQGRGQGRQGEPRANMIFSQNPGDIQEGTWWDINPSYFSGKIQYYCICQA